ncbi:tubulin epsilon and delta complex protein 1 isoform X3 [Saccopteryx bilineata]|uniref:tubulin epsilon and delta complex protein 1 isoform X3 n=1 Tax=Saccopteryx bilineata TaxID=59482 RepID=UPI003390411E
MGRGRRRLRVDPADAAGALPEAIAALSRTLPAGPSPETFRRAKFDRPEAASALWQLLFRVLSQLLADSASATPTPEAQAGWVKSVLLSQGYPRRGLAQLAEDGSQGSRELLLALAWLLAQEPLLERLLAQTRIRLGDEMPVCEIHSYTRGCHSDRSLGHLSVAETELLRDPEGGRQLLRRLESENARLEAALAWRCRELVFWQWMDTVLDVCPPETSQPTALPRRRKGRAGELELVARELQALQEELRAAVEARRAAWEARVGSREPEWNAAQRAAQEAVGRELAALRQAWERGGGRAQPHGPHRLMAPGFRLSATPGGPALMGPWVQDFGLSPQKQVDGTGQSAGSQLPRVQSRPWLCVPCLSQGWQEGWC